MFDSKHSFKLREFPRYSKRKECQVDVSVEPLSPDRNVTVFPNAPETAKKQTEELRKGSEDDPNRVPKGSERTHHHTLTIKEVGRMFEDQGVARTERTLINWTRKDALGASKLDGSYDSVEHKWYVTPESVYRAIEEEQAKKRSQPVAITDDRQTENLRSDAPSGFGNSREPSEAESRSASDAPENSGRVRKISEREPDSFRKYSESARGDSRTDDQGHGEVKNEIQRLKWEIQAKDVVIKNLQAQWSETTKMVAEKSEEVGKLKAENISLSRGSRESLGIEARTRESHDGALGSNGETNPPTDQIVE